MRERTEDNSYDLIVIGAGNAGLTAALTALDRGLSVLVLEKNLYPGGCAVSFKRGRFEFEASLHELAFVGTEDNPGPLNELFDRYGIKESFVSLPEAFRAITLDENGYDVVIRSGLQGFYDSILEAVPDAGPSLSKVYDLIRSITDAVAYFSRGKQNKLWTLLKHRDFIKASTYSVLDVLNSFEMPEKARSIFCTYWPYLGSSPDSLDMMIYLAMFEGYMRSAPAIPKHRSYALSCALEDAILKKGGHIRYHTEADRLLFDGGKVSGVGAGDQTFHASAVVSNVFPERIYAGMMPKEQIPLKDLKLSAARRFGPKFYTVYLGLNRSVEDLGIRDYTVFINQSSDPVRQYLDMASFETTPLIINFLNNAVPDASPEGTSLVYITALREAEAEDGLGAENYFNAKSDFAKILIERAERALHIDIRDHIEEIEICTPATFARYLGTPFGTPYGYLMGSWDVSMFRTMHSGEDHQIPGLTFAGAHGNNGDGYSSTYLSGVKQTERIIRDLELGKE